MRLKNIIIALLILGPVIAGYFFIQKAARDGIAEREATERYLAANPPPKPIPLKIVGCIRGKLEPETTGYIDVLKTRIRIPCDRTPIITPLVEREFYISWAGKIDVGGKKIEYRAVFQGTPKELSENDFANQNVEPMRGYALREIQMPPNKLRIKTARFDCGLDATGSVAGECRGYVVTSPNTKVLLDTSPEASTADLEALTAHFVEITRN